MTVKVFYPGTPLGSPDITLERHNENLHSLPGAIRAMHCQRLSEGGHEEDRKHTFATVWYLMDGGRMGQLVVDLGSCTCGQEDGDDR